MDPVLSFTQTKLTCDSVTVRALGGSVMVTVCVAEHPLLSVTFTE